jgi:hypothetical protein
MKIELPASSPKKHVYVHCIDLLSNVVSVEDVDPIWTRCIPTSARQHLNTKHMSNSKCPSSERTEPTSHLEDHPKDCNFHPETQPRMTVELVPLVESSCSSHRL